MSDKGAVLEEIDYRVLRGSSKLIGFRFFTQLPCSSKNQSASAPKKGKPLGRYAKLDRGSKHLLKWPTVYRVVSG